MAHDVAVSEFDNGCRGECSCGWIHVEPNTEFSMKVNPNQKDEKPVRLAEFEALKHRTQGFFADFAAEMRKPHFGDMQRQWMKALLTRAIEAKLYTPEDV